MPVAVVIPAYNEAATIAGIVHRARRQVETVIVVDDGSGDETAAQAEAAGRNCCASRSTRARARPCGVGWGRRWRRSADAVITLDADGQHCPEDMSKLLTAARRQPDRLIVAARLSIASERLARAVSPTAWPTSDSWAAGYPIRDTQSGFRLYPAAFCAPPPRPATGGAASPSRARC